MQIPRAPLGLLVLLAAACDSGLSAGASRSCSTPEGVSGSPTTVADAVELINALPKPVSIACFIEALDRPLALNATDSTASAQPASGQSPRLFLFKAELIMAVVAEGFGKDLLEFSEVGADQSTSIKAELEFPVTETIDAELAFERIKDSVGTTCGSCHSGEQPATGTGYSNAFVSQAIRPRDSSLISIESLASQAQACESAEESDRCALLKAVFDQGSVSTQAFPSSMPTFFP